MAWQDREKEWENLQAVQQKLGEISMIWSTIDRKLDQILTDLLDLAPAQTAAIVVGILPSRKAQMICRLILLSCPSQEWGTHMEALATEIGQSFGEKRNRLIHDVWRFNKAQFGQIDPRAKAQKVPFSGKALSFDNEKVMTMEGLESWCARGYEIISQLSELQPDLLPWLLSERAKLSR